MSESFDRALRGAARRGRPVGVCPDAAMLASYADNGLSADERRGIETHAADCTRCLEHLALLGAVSLDRDAPEPSRSWVARWGWLVPVATAVLVVAVWVRLPEQQAPENAVLPTPPATQAVAPGVPEQEAAAPSGLAAAPPTDERDAQGRAKQQPTARTSPALAARAASPLEKKADALAPLERRDTERQKVASETPMAAAAPPAAPVVQAQKAGDENMQSRRLGEAAGKVATPAAPAASAMADAMKEEVRAESTAPRETVRARGNRIERSRDGGSTWSSLLSEPQSSFTAVGCAQDGPCWIGTADGQVLRRMPDGFQRSVLPVRARVVSVAAEGPLTALVTLESGQRFRTADGGTTWAPIP